MNPATEHDTYLISGAKTLAADGTWVEDPILIRHGKISMHEDVPLDIRRLDATGCWVVPGLIDAHVHLIYTPDPLQKNDTLSRKLLRTPLALRRHLHSGVTTVRDLGGPDQANIDIANAVEEGSLDGPNVVAAGTFIAMTGGHMNFDGIEVDGVDEVRKAVRAQLKAGARYIKVMASGGATDPHENVELSELTEEEMSAAVEIATRAGVQVAAHAHPPAAMMAAINAGVRSIEHGTFLTPEVVEAMKAHNVAVIPTIAVYEAIASDESLPSAQRENAATVANAKIDALARAIAQGVPFGVGTDSGGFLPHGSIVDELCAMRRAGASDHELLLTVTARNAEILGISRHTGSISDGMDADLLIVESDPSLDIEALRQVRLVIKNGRAVASAVSEQLGDRK